VRTVMAVRILSCYGVTGESATLGAGRGESSPPTPGVGKGELSPPTSGSACLLLLVSVRRHPPRPRTAAASVIAIMSICIFLIDIFSS
jgi:hypothetical protein